MNTCKTCKYWVIPEDDYRCMDVISPHDPVTYEQEENEDAIAAKWGYRVRQCQHPKLEFCQRPEQNSFATIDGSEYYAKLLTGEDFGCVLHEAL
jgi:hypothetical protein